MGLPQDRKSPSLTTSPHVDIEKTELRKFGLELRGGIIFIPMNRHEVGTSSAIEFCVEDISLQMKLDQGLILSEIQPLLVT